MRLLGRPTDDVDGFNALIEVHVGVAGATRRIPISIIHGSDAVTAKSHGYASPRRADVAGASPTLEYSSRDGANTIQGLLLMSNPFLAFTLLPLRGIFFSLATTVLKTHKTAFDVDFRSCFVRRESGAATKLVISGCFSEDGGLHQQPLLEALEGVLRHVKKDQAEERHVGAATGAGRRGIVEAIEEAGRAAATEAGREETGRGRSFEDETRGPGSRAGRPSDATNDICRAQR